MASNNKELIRKYATKSVEEMTKEQDKMQEDLSSESLELDSKIRNFSTRIDPIMSDTNEVLAQAKRPSSAQFERLLPLKFLKYRDNPEGIPEEEAIAYTEDIYKLMEELIVCPRHTAGEWKNLIGDDFVAAFQAHFVKVREEGSRTVTRFLQRTTASTS